MKKLSVHLDTSVLGGCFESEFAPWSLGLMADFESGRFVPVVSEVLEAETVRAPAEVRDLYRQLVALAARVLTVGDEELSLFDAYAAHNILSNKYRDDMLHIAVASVASVDALVSWNFKHIVRFDKIRSFNAVNLEQGYKPVQIHSPREVTTYGTDRNRRG